MDRLPISVGILAWHSGRTLAASLETYVARGFFDIVADVHILFQECDRADRRLAARFGLPYIDCPENIGIGRGFLALAEHARERHVLLLEHDFHLVENADVARRALEGGLELIARGYHCVRYRHRRDPGVPHYSINRYKGRELEFVDEWIQLPHPHLLDTVHWCEAPHEAWPAMIQLDGEFFVTTSRYGNWTNNPCLYNTAFYLDTVRPFAGDGIALEHNISYWWARQGYRVAHGEGLFKHVDPEKHGSQPLFRRAYRAIDRRLRARLGLRSPRARS